MWSEALPGHNSAYYDQTHQGFCLWDSTRWQYRASLDHRHHKSSGSWKGLCARVGTHFTLPVTIERVVWLLSFAGKKRGSLSSDHCGVQLSILWLSLYPSGSCFISPSETSLRILNQQQASSVSECALKIHIKLQCFQRRTQEEKKPSMWKRCKCFTRNGTRA